MNKNRQDNDEKPELVREDSLTFNDGIEEELDYDDEDDENLVSLNLYDIMDEVIKENPELSERYAGVSREYESENDDEYDDDSTEIYSFPPRNPIYTVTLTEIVENYVCLETRIFLNKKHIDTLKAEIKSMRADVEDNLLFIQTDQSNNSHSLSVFCYSLVNGNLLWQTDNIPSDGEPYLDKERKVLELGLTIWLENNYLVLLDYNGNVLERNFGSPKEMLRAAEENIKKENHNQAIKILIDIINVPDVSTLMKFKVEAAEKLIRLGRQVGDTNLVSQFTAILNELKTSKEYKKEQVSYSIKKLNSPLLNSLYSDDPDSNAFLSKRRKQPKKDGGK